MTGRDFKEKRLRVFIFASNIDAQALKAQRIFSTKNSNSNVIVYQNDIGKPNINKSGKALSPMAHYSRIGTAPFIGKSAYLLIFT